MTDAPKEAPVEARAEATPQAPEHASPGRPLVTFFVLAYKQEKYVRAAVEGAFAQTYAPLEIILSDDHSPDGTFAVMEEMAAAYDGPHRVILNRNSENLGLVRHIDRVMELASGELMVQNAGDDVSLPERTEKLAEAWLASGRRAKLLFSPAIIIDADGTERGLKTVPSGLTGGVTPLDLIRGNLYALGAASAWDREVFDVFGSMGPGLHVEDTVIPVRAALLGEIRPLDEPLMKWRAGGLSWVERTDLRGRDYLFGERLKILRWRAASQRKVLEDLERADAPGREACMAESRAQRERLEFEIAVADAGPVGRLGLLPRALRLALARRDGVYLRQHLKYLLGPLYIRYLDWRYPPGRLRW
jgi:hypothetical protein